ncbi:hypothetical protein B0H13DRAFT_2004333 [Mycena leptocephala]|nr:hypothetical protein B0H13DRAFT_2004333 [Mycena leptocephala]
MQKGKWWAVSAHFLYPRWSFRLCLHAYISTRLILLLVLFNQSLDAAGAIAEISFIFWCLELLFALFADSDLRLYGFLPREPRSSDPPGAHISFLFIS